MEVYNLILSTSGKDHEKIPTNEVFMREGDRSSTRCVPSWHTCKCFKTSLGGGGDLCPPHRWDPPSRVALAWACRTRWCLGVGKPHPLVPWRGKPWASFGLGVGTLVPWCGKQWARFALGVGTGRADFGLGVLILALAVQRRPPKKKKKSSQNFLKFCMEVYNLILSTSGKNLEKIRTNEVFLGGG